MLNEKFSASSALSVLWAVPGHAALAAVTLFAVMGLGAWQMIGAALTPGGLTFPHSWLDLREGRTTGTLEKQLDLKLPARSALITTANSTRYLLTGSGGDQVRTGRDGWLFLTEELRFETNGATHLNARADLLGKASKELAQQGISLVVVVVPDKARVHASHLWATVYPDYLRARYPDALSALRQRGVQVVDLLQPFTAAGTDLYYRSDTHWNQVGARLAADTIAQAVKTAQPALDATLFKSVSEGAPAERSGDLIRLMGLEGVPAALRPSSDTETAILTRQTSADSPAGLFGDTVVPVVLVGTSYSLRGNFHGFLQQALSAKVLNSAKDGGGFLQAATAYLTDEAFKTSKPKVLVWEIPERQLQVPLDAEAGWLEKVHLQR